MLNAATKVLVYDRSVLQCELLSTSLTSLRHGIEVKCVCDCDSMMTSLTSDAKWVLIVSDRNFQSTFALMMRRLRVTFPDLLMVFLLQEGRSDQVIEAFRMGARGIVYSNESLAQLANCIDRVSEGEMWLRHSDLGMILEGIAKPGALVRDVNGKSLLSRREEEISRLVAEGMSNREISQALKISESTVKGFLFHVFDKLGISNRVELARYINSSTERGATGA